MAMTSESKPRVRHYVTQTRLREYLQTARDFGMDIGSFEITPDGSIRLISVAALQIPQPTKSTSYDEWKAKQLAKKACLAASAAQK